MNHSFMLMDLMFLWLQSSCTGMSDWHVLWWIPSMSTCFASYSIKRYNIYLINNSSQTRFGRSWSRFTLPMVCLQLECWRGKRLPFFIPMKTAAFNKNDSWTWIWHNKKEKMMFTWFVLIQDSRGFNVQCNIVDVIPWPSSFLQHEEHADSHTSEHPLF